MVHAKGSLVLKMTFVANIEVIVGIRRPRHHHHVRLAYILQEKALEKRIDPVRRNLIVGKLNARVRKIRRSSWQTWVEIGILDRRRRIVDFDVAYAEIAPDFVLCRNGQNLCVRLRQAQALVIDKEKCLLPDERTAERSAEIVLHQVIVAHGREGAGIHRTVAQKFVYRSVILTVAKVRDDINLAAAGAAHVRSVTAGFHLKFFTRIGQRTQLLRVERGIGVCGAVEQKKVRVGATATNDHGGALPWTPVEWIRGSRLM